MESAIAKLQLVEWGLREGLRAQRFALNSWRREAIEELREFGLSPAPHVAQVLHAWAPNPAATRAGDQAGFAPAPWPASALRLPTRWRDASAFNWLGIPTG